MKKLAIFLVLLLCTSAQGVMLLDGNVPPGCTNVVGALTCTSFTGDGSGLTSVPMAAAGDNLTVQYNNSGTLCGDGNITINPSTHTLSATQFIGGGAGITGVDGNDSEIDRLITTLVENGTLNFSGASYSTTRTDAAQCIYLFEATSDGDSNSTICVPTKGTGLAASRTITLPDASGTVVLSGGTTITKYQYLPIAYAEDNGTSPPASAAVITGKNVKARAFDKATNEAVIFHWQVDPEWTSGLKYRVYYALAANAAADNNATFELSGCSMGNSDDLACTPGTAVEVNDVLGEDDDANQTMISDWSGAVTVTNQAAGELTRLLFIRDAASDDFDNDVYVIGIELKYQAKISASSDY